MVDWIRLLSFIEGTKRNKARIRENKTNRISLKNKAFIAIFELIIISNES